MKDYEVITISDDVIPPASTPPDSTIPAFAGDSAVSYEVESPDGSKETIQAGAPLPPNPMALARHRLNQLRLAHRLLRLRKREAKLSEKQNRKKQKSKAKRAVQKASRQANRG